MARLRGEDAAPLVRLKKLEMSGACGGVGGGGEDLVPRASLEVTEQAEEAIPAEELKDKETDMLQLRQASTHTQHVSNSKDAEFRKSVEDILGVKLALSASGACDSLTVQLMFKRRGIGCACSS
ncbi:hypothetical protein WOLCODRAFT_164925 [Wolfiporia cocos MD-104 SS10]|uniref:Uncharacterized protein n=1 Tax=Wolfiporia cocos (strain MD-104) TaxID=742152 RepID=A0A2H3JQC1_WOLCO|nr:hypothetical protein WOLCODRAFT_164925 [Wolfiporia cocos MD-104 SS10]